MKKSEIIQTETYRFMRFQMWFYLIFSLLLVGGITFLVISSKQYALSLIYVFPFLTFMISFYYLMQLNMIKKHASSFQIVEGMAVHEESSWHPRLFGIVFEYKSRSGQKLLISSYHVFRAFEVKAFIGHAYHIIISPESFHALLKDLTPRDEKVESIMIND